MVFSRRYIAALFSTALALATPAIASGQTTARGAVLPGGSKEVGQNRFRSPMGYADTLTFFGKTYKTNPRKPIVNQPGLRGVHIVNDSRTGEWEGLNVYEFEGETRIFVVPRDPEPKKQ